MLELKTDLKKKEATRYFGTDHATVLSQMKGILGVYNLIAAAAPVRKNSRPPRQGDHLPALLTGVSACFAKQTRVSLP